MQRVWFKDSNGEQWEVREQVLIREGEEAGQRSLLFMNPTKVRRVRSYPTDWMTLSAEDLEALSWST